MKNTKYHFMKLALDESRKALPDCLPNPPVGALIVYNEHIIGRGHTQRFGGKHAEIMAIESINDIDFSECEMYVTLEPCSFYGKTPPCVNRLISARFNKIYIGIVDKHIKNNGKGIELLKSNGIETEVGVLENEVSMFINKYLWSK
ncbi:bifunctional diaminohydroxyphosphoribosylaminopyrimidine deaminase/5-amino-6-(5-phosphoribosylamino)uracil reductase RibD [Lonsdalea quercina]|uniref:bifunctional diaminohydroxyphosphoribosylaminopyrimidine deaminase/5-amino-6-(5-phosphoribosylamino)uracil reductase RibD n=1 Tax=Lonsdalea quercina TaxID=71657 RepID=UPI003974ADBA